MKDLTDINHTLNEFQPKIHYQERNKQHNKLSTHHYTVNTKQPTIYSKPILTNLLTHNTSHHPIQHEMAAVNYKINRIYTCLIK